MNEAARISRYRGLQGSTVTVFIRCPIVFILLTGSFVEFLEKLDFKTKERGYE
jgi:hypothetical protein